MWAIECPRPFDKDLVVGFGIGGNFDGLDQALLMRFELLPAATGAADTVPFERSARFDFFDALVDGVAVHARSPGKGSNAAEAIGFDFTSGVMPPLLLIQLGERIPPFLFDAYLFSVHGTYTVPHNA
jgi:hypothetical protein